MTNNSQNNNNNDPQIFPFIPTREQIRSFKRTMPVSIYDFYISDEIKSDVDVYIELIHTLKTADVNDTIFIYLNTPGGDLYTTVQLLSAMNASHAKIVTCMEGRVCSAGTFIFLKGDVKLINPHCTFMIHNYSQTTSGKGNEVVQQINYMGDYFNRLAADIYKNFLTKKEIDEVIRGNDLWFHSNEVAERLAEKGHEYIYTGSELDLSLKIDTKLSVGEEDGEDETPVTKPRAKKVSRSKKRTSKK